MSWGSRDQIHRTAKILIDADIAADPAAAAAYLERLVLQVAVGAELEHDHAAQAALATAVNVGRRAFHGGIHVQLHADPVLTTGWTAGKTASQVVTRYGGTLVSQLDPAVPTLTIGRPLLAVGAPLLHLTWRGWSGGVVRHEEDIPAGRGEIPAGVLAAALGVSETFQRQLGSVVAGRRDIGISLWDPSADWLSADPGPHLEYLPAELWLLGLGHLGQAYGWTIGLLPYATPAEVALGLVDFDVVVEGNAATQLLVTAEDASKRKTRIVAAALETLGFNTRMVERAFDEHFHPIPHAKPERNEPTWALAGFDDVAPRRILGPERFEHVVDAGLGSGPVDYLDMLVHAFPDAGNPAEAFPEPPRPPKPLRAAYERALGGLARDGGSDPATRCGLLDIAGVAVGAAFVGTTTATLVLADVLRRLHDGKSYAVIALDLRNPNRIKAVPSPSTPEVVLPKHTRARRSDEVTIVDARASKGSPVRSTRVGDLAQAARRE
jgi:hypothetical protein